MPSSVHLLFALFGLCSVRAVSGRIHASLIPEDPHAFPKYDVTFLNGLPVLNETAERWLRDGLQGGLLEFLEEPWVSKNSPWSKLKEIDPTEPSQSLSSPPSREPESVFKLELMKMGPNHSYLCLIPPEPPISDNPSQLEDSSEETTLIQSWNLLQALSGKCLYHRQGWFTYSYCHNSHVRQFREAAHTHPHPIGYKPEEDTEWEAYTLGQAPETTPESGADLTIAEQNALAVNLELARGTGSRYLIQRWGDGTVCDKTGREREIEIQFHCSMTVTDTILFIKETATCHYVLVIQTPRLCGDPAFRSRRDSQEQSTIRCREVIQSAEELKGNDLPPEVEAQVPLHVLASEKEFRDQMSQPLPKEKSKKRGKAPVIDDALLAKIVNQLRSKGIGNFNREKTLVVEDPDNVDTVFLVELENDDVPGRGQGQQDQLEIQVSEEAMQALLEQARNTQPPVDEGEDEY
ncbi:hypothetical protein BDM02DRAFT_3233209 [Thelephora ganbajun]|uniref:Uncharacterized protein n=1 Tax=Thelephora ganbajun TaxID=370292 RepID=A0ACB6YZU4_THEGA|nr:hypothetical protein BDM02DRAFT_3233209 [Thelephora ganbajun]